jgi:hypothetical protein
LFFRALLLAGTAMKLRRLLRSVPTSFSQAMIWFPVGMLWDANPQRLSTAKSIFPVSAKFSNPYKAVLHRGGRSIPIASRKKVLEMRFVASNEKELERVLEK